MARGNSRSGGYRSRFGFQENDRVLASEEREEHTGSWDRDPDNVPGAQNADGSPDMRDDVNREEFLGESREDRSFQRAANIMRGAIARGIDPQELIEVAQQEAVTPGRASSGDQGRRSQGRGYDRDYDRDRDRGSGSRRGESGRDRQYRRNNSRQIEDVCRSFEQDHRAEEDGLRMMRDIIDNARGQLGNRDFDNLKRICQDSMRVSDNERNSVRQIEQAVRNRKVGDLCADARRYNDNEYSILQDMQDAIRHGDGRKVQDLCDELEDAGRAEGDIFNELEDALMNQSGSGSSGDSSRGGSSSRRSGSNRGGGEGDYPRNNDGSADLRDDRNRERFIEQRGGTSIHNRSRGGRPENKDGSRDLRDPENRREYMEERGYSGRQPRDD